MTDQEFSDERPEAIDRIPSPQDRGWVRCHFPKCSEATLNLENLVKTPEDPTKNLKDNTTHQK